MSDSPIPLVCPVCNGEEIEPEWLVESNSDGILADTYWVHRCRRCKTGLSCPVPEPEVLSKYYRTGVYGKSGGRANHLIDIVLSALCDQRLREIHRYQRPPNSLLDVGCGKGRFIARATRHGWDAQGMDVSPSQVAAARARYGVRVSQGQLQEVGFGDTSFSVVTAWHVMEHAQTPHPFISEVRRILQPNGLFVCEVPNFASWQARLTLNRWFHLDVPRHLVHYTPKAIETLLAKHGLRLVRLHTFSVEMGPFGMLQSMLNLAGLSPNWLFRWLKRSVSDDSHRETLLNTVAALLTIVPASSLELAASVVGRGGLSA